jgi:hypothetical protein
MIHGTRMMTTGDVQAAATPRLPAVRRWGAVAASVPGRLVVLGCLFGYFLVLLWRGGHSAWGWFQVPETSPSFLDLRSITSGWVCTRRGVDVLVSNPCDPFPRPANYPRIWMWPAGLGLGQGATLILGLLVAAGFFAAALALVRPRCGLGDAAIWASVLVSPAVMLGIERGNADLILFPLVVVGILLLRARTTAGRVAGNALLLFAAMLKLFPAFAFVALLRQPRRWRLWGGGLVVLGFGIYVLATLGDIRTIERVLPQDIYYSYGADVGVRATVDWLAARSPSLAFAARDANERIALVALIAGALVVAGLVARSWRPPAAAREGELDLFLAGTAVFAGTFVLEHNFDYRLVYLLLAVPQLLAWARTSTLARVVLGSLVLTLWLNESLSNWYWRFRYPLPYDELVNWLLFSCLVGMALAAAAPSLAAAVRQPRRWPTWRPVALHRSP